MESIKRWAPVLSSAQAVQAKAFAFDMVMPVRRTEIVVRSHFVIAVPCALRVSDMDFVLHKPVNINTLTHR